MKHITLQQSTPEWHAHRAAHFNASDAPAMLGQSPYKTRAELVKQHATGIVPDVDPAAQRRFDAGHRFEALARPLAEEIIGEELYPVTGVLDGSKLSASFDGLTMLEDVAFEHKTLNDGLRAALVDGATGTALPLNYQIQMEQQCMVSGCDKVLFMASQWDAEGNLVEERHCWYTPNAEIRQQIIAGWALFEQDVAAYKANPPAEVVKVQAEVVESLPAVAVQLNGALVVVSNLDKFGDALRAFVDRIPAKPATDQEFANAEAACKTLKQAEDALDAAESQALAQISDVEQLRRTVANLKNLARTTRLATDKLVKAEKENRKLQIVMEAQTALANHVAKTNAALPAPAHIPQQLKNFGEEIKGLKSFDSMQDKVKGALAAEIAAVDALALKLTANRASLNDAEGKDWILLFADFNDAGQKETADFKAIAALRIGQHKQAEADRLEAEREKIRTEEAAKLKAKNDAKEAEEAKAKAESERIAAGALAPAAQSSVAAPAPPATSYSPSATGYRRHSGHNDYVKPVPQHEASAPEDDGSRVKLGQINALIAPHTLTADGLAQLGFVHVDTDKSAKLYRECDLPAIAMASARHFLAIAERLSAEQLATA
ncbi:endonuclease [Lampropedia aestuarii]|uniref:Endonuclease n=1 Tax=Lampropedia aestuarii TaxID=2562762 RepID=A0A4S5BJM7_9BURK|nr:YqaJ viral recombinase family protein [Lampropedia aestuarii]THJ32379.1 endonuclease [Lampropedia aestuarii]